MTTTKRLKRPLLSFIILSYVIFFVFFITIGISIMIDAPDSIVNVLQIISAWSSTFAFMILFRRIFPTLRLIDFVRKQFKTKLKISVLSSAVVIQVVITAVVMFLLSQTYDPQHIIGSVTSIGMLIFTFSDSLVRGPLGEELGWRGYALNELQKKHSPLRAALIIGALWGFWHAPLWFASGFTGVDLIIYIVLFMIGIVSFSVIVTLFYNLNKNLLIPIVIHQLFNFSVVIMRGDLLHVFVYVMLSYLVVALLLVIFNPRGILYSRVSR